MKIFRTTVSVFPAFWLVLGAWFPLAHAQIAYPPSFGKVNPEGRYEARLVEVYQQDFEGALDGVFLNGATVTTTAPIGGAKSILLGVDFATVRLEPSALGLDPLQTYYIEFDYQVLDPGTETAPFGLFFDWTGVDPAAQDVSGPITGVYPVSGSFRRSIRVGNANDAKIWIIAFDGRALIDNIRVYRHDSILVSAEPPLWEMGFPRLLSYHLGSVGNGAARHGKLTTDIAQTLALFDVVSGGDIDHTTDGLASLSFLRDINPELIAMPYLEAFVLEVNAQAVSTGGSSNLTALFQDGIESAWYMRGPDGSLLDAPFFPGHFQMNHTGQGSSVDGVDFNEYVHHYMRESVLPSGLWQGIHLDQTEWFPNPLLGANDGFNTVNEPLPPIDLDEDGIAESDAELAAGWEQGFHSYLSALRRQLGPSALIYGNSGLMPLRGSILSRLNGVQSELTTPFPVDAAGDWDLTSMSDWYDLHARQQLADRHLTAPAVAGIQYTGIKLGTPSANPGIGIQERAPTLEARDYHRMRFGLASTLLHDSGFYGYNLVGASSYPVWFDEYAVNAAGVAEKSLSARHYLGQPLAAVDEVRSADFQIVTEADFENGGDNPVGMFLAPGFTLTEDPAEVLNGTRSAIFDYDPADPPSGLIFGLNQAEVQLTPGAVYQAAMRYRVLSLTDPQDYSSVAFVGFESPAVNELFATATLWEADVGQVGELRTGVLSFESGINVVSGFTGPARLVVDDIQVMRGSSVFRRDFENGIVLVNPSPREVVLSQADVAGVLGRTGIHRIQGTQDAVQNDGSAVTAGLTLNAGDAIILLADAIVAAPPTMPAGIFAVPGTTTAEVGWTAASGTVAGYVVRYGLAGGDLTQFRVSGKTPTLLLEDLEAGADYEVQVAAFDFLGQQTAFTAAFSFSMPGTPVERPIITGLSPLSPGAIVEISGQFIDAPAQSVVAPYPDTLGSMRVLVNGLPAPLLHVGGDKVLMQVPWNIGGDRAVVRLEKNGVVGPGRFETVKETLPVLWTWAQDFGIALRPNTFLAVLDTSPAVPGEHINLLASNLGVLEPLPGSATLPAADARPVHAPKVLVDGIEATVVDTALLSGTVAFYLVTIEVPAGIASGLLNVTLESAGETSNTVKVSFDGAAVVP